MHKAIAHHPLTDAQHIPRDHPTLPCIYQPTLPWCGTPLWPAQAVLAVSPSSPWCTPSLLAGRAVPGAESWALCEHGSSTVVTLGCYCHFFHQKPRTQHRNTYQEANELCSAPAKTRTLPSLMVHQTALLETDTSDKFKDPYKMTFEVKISLFSFVP